MMYKGKQLKPDVGRKQELLWDYLKDNLPAEEREKMEQEIANDDFLRDALEGLSEMQDERAARSSTLLLQRQLRRHIQSRKKRQLVSLQPRLWIWVAALVLLLFVFLAWWALSYFVSPTL